MMYHTIMLQLSSVLFSYTLLYGFLTFFLALYAVIDIITSDFNVGIQCMLYMRIMQ